MYRVLCLRELKPQTFMKNAYFNASRCLQFEDGDTVLVRPQPQRGASSRPDFSKLVRVYTGTLSSQIKAVKVFSLASSIGGIMAQPILIQRASEVGGTPLTVAMFGFVGFFTLVTPILLHLLTRRYVFEMYYDPKTHQYTALIINFFLWKKYITFTPEEVKIPDTGGMFTSFVAKGKPLFVEPSTFNSPEHYGKIMGYDKPLDLRLGEMNEKVGKGKEI